MATTSDSIKDTILKAQWTRSTINSFATSSFEALDTILTRLEDAEYGEVSQFCKEQLQTHKSDIYSLYILGLLELKKNTLNDQQLIAVAEIFSDNHKPAVVEFLAKKILSFGSNLVALKMLAEVYEHNNEKEKLVHTWDLIAKEDFEEADIVVKLAKYNSDAGNKEHATAYYKKAINRYLAQKNYQQIKAIWTILSENQKDNIDFLLKFEKKVEKVLSPEKTLDLLNILLDTHLSVLSVDLGITILKRFLSIDPENIPRREQLVELYRKKFSDNPKLEDFIQNSNLLQHWRSVNTAIATFEKHIAFSPSSFVYHSQWGVGRIREITNHNLYIDFSKRRNHQMELGMAVTSLEVLPKDHFWVYKSVLSKDKIRDLVINKKTSTLKNIIKSFNSADLKKIKVELVPDILRQSEWNSWSLKAKKILSENPLFGINRENSDHYDVSSVPVSPFEKIYTLFKSEEKFIAKVKYFDKVLTLNLFSEDEDDFDQLLELYETFSTIVKKEKEKSVIHYITSVLVCLEASTFPLLSSRVVPKTLHDFVKELHAQEILTFIREMSIAGYKDKLLNAIIDHSPDWENQLVQAFPFHQSLAVVARLEQEQQTSLLSKIFLNIHQNYARHRPAYIWFINEFGDRDWILRVVTSQEIAAVLLRIGIFVAKEIQNSQEIQANRKFLLQVEKILFDRNYVDTFFKSENEETIKYFYSLINELSDVLPARIIQVRERIAKTIPDFDFGDTHDIATAGSSIFYTLESTFLAKQKELSHLFESEIPLNSKEIEKARSYGDLKENAEYKAALEKQSYLNTRVGQLKKELEHARYVSLDDVDISEVNFGTCITLLDENNDSINTYTILGPWESDPSNNVISYVSPLGRKLYKHKNGESFSFSLNNQEHIVTIKNIEPLTLKQAQLLKS